MFDIVTGYYPESKPKDDTPARRPCLVTRVYEDVETGVFACEIVYGSKHHKIATRSDKDIIIQNFSHLDEMGLPLATRFDLGPENRVVLGWDEPDFRPWNGYRSPRLGHLLLHYQKEYAWLMAKQASV